MGQGETRPTSTMRGETYEHLTFRAWSVQKDREPQRWEVYRATKRGRREAKH